MKQKSISYYSGYGTSNKGVARVSQLVVCQIKNDKVWHSAPSIGIIFYRIQFFLETFILFKCNDRKCAKTSNASYK